MISLFNLIDGVGPHVESIDETARPKLIKDKTAMSAITRSSSMGNREKSDLEKSLQRQATTTSIGLDLRSERSSMDQIKVKPLDADDKEEHKLKLFVSTKRVKYLIRMFSKHA